PRLAGFCSLRGLALDAQGNIFVADSNNRRIRQLDLAGNVFTVAGSDVVGQVDGLGQRSPASEFQAPAGVLVDAAGNVLVADTGNSALRKIDRSGNVTTFAGSLGRGYADGPATTAQFNAPTVLLFDSAGV